MPSWTVVKRAFTFPNEEGNWKIGQGIPRVVSIREISTMQLKKCYRKGYQIFAAHMGEESKDKVQIWRVI